MQKKTYKPSQAFKHTWDFIAVNRSTVHVLGHDIRNVIGRSIGWASLLPKSPPLTSSDPQLDSSATLLAETLKTCEQIKIQTHASLDAVDQFIKKLKVYKVIWFINAANPTVHFVRRGVIFVGVTPRMAETAPYVPKEIFLDNKLETKALSETLQKLKNRGARISAGNSSVLRQRLTKTLR